ncbi:hypothetical protein FOCC_FOCC008638 [Frankliniella occidentalis]|nr:hypothetical protein FOCC_FOCC008638 [Frankliniella occidentalis]
MGGNKKKKSTCYVYVKNLTNNKKYALSADLLYHWNGNANEAQEKFDPSKPFHSSNQYCVFYAGKAVRHAAYHVAETRELCLSKTKEVGGMSLRPSVVPARKSLTPAEVSNTVTLSQMEMADAKAMEESAESKRKEVHGDRKKVKNEMNNNKSNKENPIKKKKSKLNKTSPVNDINQYSILVASKSPSLQDTLPSDETEAHREKHYEMGHAKIAVNQRHSNRACLPRPRRLPWTAGARVAAVLALLWLLLLLRAGLGRLSRAVCAYFYPRRERRRVLRLYNEALRRRWGLARSMRARVRVLAAQGRLEQRHGLQHALAAALVARWPRLRGWLLRLRSARRSCAVCGERERRDEAPGWSCAPAGHVPLYLCRDCWAAGGGECPACAPPRPGEDDEALGLDHGPEEMPEAALGDDLGQAPPSLQDTLPSDETEAHREKHYEMGHAKIVCESLKEKGTVGESPRKQSFVRALSPPSQVRSPMKAAEQPPWIDPQTQHLPLHENLMKQFENNDQRTPDKGLDDTDFSSDFSDREKKKPNRKENLKRRSSASEVSNVSLLKEDQTPVLVGPNKSALGSGSKRPSCNDVNSGPTKKVKDDGAVCNSTFNTMTTAITKDSFKAFQILGIYVSFDQKYPSTIFQNSDCSCGSNYIDLCKRLETVEVALNLVSTSNKKLFDLVSKMYNTGKKCRISQLERAVEGYDDIPVPDDCVLVGELNGSMQFLSKEDIVTMEKKKTSLKGRILELGRLFYGDNYYLYSLVGIKNKIEKTYEFKMETPHITAIAKILQCLRWTKSEDLSSSNIGRMMGKYFSEARKVVEKAEEERQMKAFHASQQAKSVDPKKNSDDSDSSNQNE